MDVLFGIQTRDHWDIVAARVRKPFAFLRIAPPIKVAHQVVPQPLALVNKTLFLVDWIIVKYREHSLLWEVSLVGSSLV